MSTPLDRSKYNLTPIDKAKYDLTPVDAAPAAPGQLAAPADVQPTADDDDATLAQKAGVDFALIQRSPAYKPGMLSAAAKFGLSLPNDIVGGLVQGATNVAGGLVQHGLRGAAAVTRESGVQTPDGSVVKGRSPVDPTLALFEAMQTIQKGGFAQSQKQPALTVGGSAPGEFIAEAVAPSPLPGGKAKTATKVGEFVKDLVNPVTRGKQVIAGGARGATEAALMPEYEASSDPALTEGKAGERAALGGGVGAGVTGALGVGGKVASKVINAQAGRYDPKVNVEAMKYLQDKDIPFNVADLSKWMPLSKAILRDRPARDLKTMERLQAEIQSKMNKLGDDAAMTQWRALKPLQDASVDPNSAYKADAEALLSQLQRTNLSNNEMIKLSGELGVLRGKVLSEKLYNNVDTLGAGIKAGNLPKYRKVVEDAIAAEQRKSVVGERGNDQLDALMQLRAGNERLFPDMNLAEVRAARKDLPLKAKDLAKVPGLLPKLREAMTEDMADAARRAGNKDYATELGKADKFYAKAVESQETKLAKTVETDPPPDTVYSKLLRSGARGTKDSAERAYAALDPKGRKAVRAEMLQTAIDMSRDATGEVRPEAVGQIMERLQRENAIFFKGHDKFELKGLINMLKHMESAKPPGGGGSEQVVQRAFGGAGVTAGSVVSGNSATAGVASALGLVGGKRFMDWMVNSTPEMQRFWVAASDLQPGTPAMDKLIEQMLARKQAAARGAARESVNKD